jgi:hypothetical protein
MDMLPPSRNETIKALLSLQSLIPNSGDGGRAVGGGRWAVGGGGLEITHQLALKNDAG